MEDHIDGDHIDDEDEPHDDEDEPHDDEDEPHDDEDEDEMLWMMDTLAKIMV